MITITVNGHPLAIPADTVLTLEQHNAAFSTDDIGSDIVWTFDLPALPNSDILDRAQFVALPNYRRYPCCVSVGAIPIAYGKLYIQQVADEKRLSCGIILDGLNAAFGSKKMCENDYGPDVIISQPSDSLDNHRQAWLQFLTSSLASDSIFKFFLFYDPDFYKDNPDFGYFHNTPDQQNPSPLQNSGAADLATHFVNRLFIASDGSIIQNPATNANGEVIHQGLRIFNERNADGTPCNGYTFAPAIRLDWLVRRLFAAAGFTVSGTFLRDTRISRLFIQSLNAMDGDLAQLGSTEHLFIESGAIGYDTLCQDPDILDVGVGNDSFKAFVPHGSTAPLFNWSFNYDTDTLQRNIPLTPNRYEPYTIQNEVLLLVIRPANSAMRQTFYRAAVSTSYTSSRDFIYGSMPHNDKFHHALSEKAHLVMGDNNQCTRQRFLGTEEFSFLDPFQDFYCIQVTSSQDNNVTIDDGQDADIVGRFLASQMLNLDNYRGYVVSLCKASIDSVAHGDFINSIDMEQYQLFLYWDQTGRYEEAFVQIPNYGQLERVTILDTISKPDLANTNTLLNIFDRAIRWNQHMPNLTNSEFIKTICQTFGLSLFTDPLAHTVQLDFFADVLKAGGIDLSDYVTSAERLTYDPKRYVVTLSPLLSTATVAEDYLLDAIATSEDLPAPRTNKKKSVFVENELAYRTSVERTDESTSISKYYWEQNHGDDRQLIVGQADTDTPVNIDVGIPAMHLCDASRTHKHLCRVQAAGCSKLLDDDYTGEFPLVLQQYLGRRDIILGIDTQGIIHAEIEYANPVGIDQSGNAVGGALSLSAVGKNSIGDLFLKPYYRFMADCENYRFTLRVPAHVFLSIRRLLTPQVGAPIQQHRWVIIESQRYLPSLISYEFSAADTVTVTIEASRAHHTI